MSQRWSYHVVEFKPDWMGGIKREKIQEELSRQGALGWELVNIVMTSPLKPALAVFKKAQ